MCIQEERQFGTEPRFSCPLPSLVSVVCQLMALMRNPDIKTIDSTLTIISTLNYHAMIHVIIKSCITSGIIAVDFCFLTLRKPKLGQSRISDM